MDWCLPWTRSVSLYGHYIPSITLFIFGVTFNPIALYYFATSRNFRRSAYSYYFSAIAVFDLIRLTIWCSYLLIDYKIYKLNFPEGGTLCSIQVFSESVASSTSVWLTVSLTVERCLVTFNPLQVLNDTKGRRALIIIFSVILASCAINSLFLHPKFYEIRIYQEHIRTTVCYYKDPYTIPVNQTNSTNNSILTPNVKLAYSLSTIIIRVVIPFVLLLTANIILFLSVRQTEKQSLKSKKILLVRHGHHRQITPLIFFSSCILLLTVSPRYLTQFYVNFRLGSGKKISCTLTHFAPHLLKTLELSNYSFNVFISIASGKHSRYELFNMLLCRSDRLRSKFQHSSINQSSVLAKLQSHKRLSNKTDNQTNSTHKSLLSNNNNFQQL
ncbi:unnamed protein product [Adineta steineri]|uniref:G-protein coupled receptors family 1 profile domain-containing protein n=1 Tax=Adineta steineri TaxID=433720 RepID=A0A814JIV4_9BILA|nr:unnamed protein product [Adineta steineri]CAF1108157.1 unnamed protein product [Adineta steineri]CAF1138698.1 unnamed protein product [Adineta steineri]CAF3604245.1 unnamed protein product [Adineta steineri]CAF4038914.1 unnamed protein product [Adineta steineri]